MLLLPLFDDVLLDEVLALFSSSPVPSAEWTGRSEYSFPRATSISGNFLALSGVEFPLGLSFARVSFMPVVNFDLRYAEEPQQRSFPRSKMAIRSPRRSASSMK